MTDARGAAAPLAGPGPLIDVHAHFYQQGSGRASWQELNASRLEVGDRIGVTWHVGSILGTWGATSPTYFQSPDDTAAGNDAMLGIQQAEAGRVRSWVAVNPNDSDFALAELERCRRRGAVGIKLAAARRATDPLLDPLMHYAKANHLPVLHHAWQRRPVSVAGQDPSDAIDLCHLACRHPDVAILLAHIGGGGDWSHTLAAVRDVPNVYLDLSGSGVDRGMLDQALEAVGAGRLVWGADLTLDTGLAKLWALDVIGVTPADRDAIRWKNAARLFPPGAFPGLAA
ncbi:MAG TPA: amidohydrolase family protein [Gemmatimonadaceae bacterium]|nr:amidohydrolase family protein [Gemmatimonadaceae bacterium]